MTAPTASVPAGSLRAFLALAGAGYRRFSTYRQATFASAFTNTVFGFLKCYVILAVAGDKNTLVGYDRAQLVAFTWLAQGLLGVLGVWVTPDLVERIKSGDVTADLLRPVDLMWDALATDTGRALYGLTVRFVAPIVVGALCFDFYVPAHGITYPLFVLSMCGAVVICFCCRYLIALLTFWMMDIRGVWTAWVLVSGLFGGLQFPIGIWPDWLSSALWSVTPFPLLFQGPLDVFVERRSFDVLGRELVWVVILVGACRLLQARALRKLVVQGG